MKIVIEFRPYSSTSIEALAELKEYIQVNCGTRVKIEIEQEEPKC